jgi:hypothetical protein
MVLPGTYTFRTRNRSSIGGDSFSESYRTNDPLGKSTHSSQTISQRTRSKRTMMDTWSHREVTVCEEGSVGRSIVGRPASGEQRQ